MRTKKSLTLPLALFVALALLNASQLVWGQEVTANIVGTVTDPSGAPIKGAAVTATDTDRGTVWNTETNDAGTYNLLRLPIGSYTVKVTAAGFQSVSHAPFTLTLNQTARVDVQLKVGKVSETVEVTSAAPVLQTETTEVSTLINSSTLVSMPLAARNYVQLTLLAPGATHVNPEGISLPQNMLNAGRPYINGNREQANSFLLDGQINNESKNNETAYNPGIDAIQEFNLITQNASAEFGNYEGGVVSATIKSGTNRFHGNLFEFFRNDALNANKYWNGMTKGIPAFEGAFGHNADGSGKKPLFRYNQFGATFGGPIIRDKLFFFVDYQGQRYKTFGETGAELLTTAERGGNFADICVGGFDGSGVCKDRDSTSKVINQLYDPNHPANAVLNNNLAPLYPISPVVQNLLNTKYYPVPQNDTAPVTGNNYFFSSGTQLNNDQGDVKIDYVATTKDRLFFRWSQMNLRNPSFSDLTLFAPGGLIVDPIRNAVASWSHTFSPHLINEFRVGFGAVHYTQQGTSTDVLGNFGEQLGITGANAQSKGMLQLQISGIGSGNPTLGASDAVQIFHTTEGQIEDNVNYTRGRHGIKAGFQFWRERQDYNYGGNYGQLGYLSISSATGFGLADFWMGNVGGGNRDGLSNTVFGLRGNIFGAYVQDDWRITNNLTLNLGIRFEDHTPFYEIKNRAVGFDLMSGAILVPGQAGVSRDFYKNYTGIGDWNPRIGFSWTPQVWGGKTVIRGGYGISQYLEGSGANEALTQNPPFYGAQETAKTGVQNIAAGFGGNQAPCNGAINFACYAGIRIRVFDQHFRPAMAQQWNLTFQHQLNNSTTLQLGYIGQHGTHLLNFFDATQLMGLNAAGKIARPGELIVSKVAGPYLGGGTAGSLYLADNNYFNPPGCSSKPPTITTNPPCGSNAIAGVNMSNSSQRYDALQAVLQKRMSNGLEGQVAYTFSKCLSNSPGYFGTGWGSSNALSSGGQPGWQNSYDGRADWGPCFYDQTHILSSYVTYQLPLGRGKQFGHDMSPALNAVVGNWEIGGIVTLHTGNALTLNEFGGWGNFQGDPSGTNGIGNYFLSARPSCSGGLHTVNKLVPGGTATNPGAGYIQWFDTSNVTDAAPNTFGTCSVGNGRGPGLADVDLSLHKSFLFTESKRLEFRMEAINAFNHRVLTFSGGPAAGSFDPGSPVFGQITGSQSARNLQLALKFYF